MNFVRKYPYSFKVLAVVDLLFLVFGTIPMHMFVHGQHKAVNQADICSLAGVYFQQPKHTHFSTFMI